MRAQLCSQEPFSEAFGYSSEDFGGGSYLGVDTRDVTADRLSDLKLKEEHGVEVTLVDQDAPAGKAGVKEHDVILSINGNQVESVEQLRRMIREIPPGRLVTLGVSRDGQSLTLKAQLADRKKTFAMGGSGKSFSFAMPAMPAMPAHARHAGNASRSFCPRDGHAGLYRGSAFLRAQRVDGGKPYSPAGRFFRREKWKGSSGALR